VKPPLCNFYENTRNQDSDSFPTFTCFVSGIRRRFLHSYLSALRNQRLK